MNRGYSTALRGTRRQRNAASNDFPFPLKSSLRVCRRKTPLPTPFIYRGAREEVEGAKGGTKGRRNGTRAERTKGTERNAATKADKERSRQRGGKPARKPVDEGNSMMPGISLGLFFFFFFFSIPVDRFRDRNF